MPIKILLVLALLAISFSNFGRGLPKEHFCEIILKLGHWPRRKCRLNVFFFLFLALDAILFSGAKRF